MSDIQPGAYVRAVGGMYQGTTGRVVSVGQSASGPFASVDVGETHPIAVFVTGLELVGEAPPAVRAEAEHWYERLCEVQEDRSAAVRILNASLGTDVLETEPEEAAQLAASALAKSDRMREGVEALAAAVLARLAELDEFAAIATTDDAAEVVLGAVLHAELSEVAESLRVILAGGER